MVYPDDVSVSTLSDHSNLNEGIIEMIVRNNYKNKKGWQALSFWEKYALFNKWYLVSSVGNILTIFGSVCYLI